MGLNTAKLRDKSAPPPCDDEPERPVFNLVLKQPLPQGKVPFRSALMHTFELLDEAEGVPAGTNLVNVAVELITAARAGNEKAMAMLLDRIDGKAPQGIELTGEGGGPIQIAEMTPLETAKRMLFSLSRLQLERQNSLPPPLEGTG